MTGISAQVSIYPLGQDSLSPAIDVAIRILRQHGLSVEVGPMSTLVSGEDDALFTALHAAFREVATEGGVAMVSTFSNSCPLPAPATEETVSYQPIGHVENAFEETAPPEEIRAVESRIHLDPALQGGLDGLEVGQELLVIFYFHRSQGYDLHQHPRRDASRPPRGVFALRSPRRPNPIGVTRVEVLAIEANVLHVRGLDAINGTPVLDLKPA